MILFFLILGISALSSIICGWSTFRKFSLIGRLRTLSQLISYEAVIYIIFCFFLSVYVSFDLFQIESEEFSFLLLLAPSLFYVWFPSILAELNRTPYDFSEGERELVRGFNIEFGSKEFTLIFLAEYGNIVFFRLVTSLMFFSFRLLIAILTSLYII